MPKKGIRKIKSAGLTGKIADIIKNVFGSSDKVNLTFKDFSNPSSKPANSIITNNVNGIFSETINLNLSKMQGSSQEFATIIMVHETLHAYMNYNGQSKLTQLAQHQEMAEKYVSEIKSFVQQLYPIKDNEAYSIILNGLGDAFSKKPSYFETLKTKYKVTDMAGNYELQRTGLSGTTCK